MEADQVIQKILSDAKAEAEKIAAAAAEKTSAEQKKLDEQLSQYRAQTQQLAQKAAQEERLHVLAGARMANAKDYLAQKAALLDEVFTRAKQRVQQLPDHEYRELMIRLMTEAVETGDEEVIVGTNEGRIDHNLVNEVNARLSGQGKGRLRLADERQNLPGGFILRRGKIKTNVSIDVLLDRAKTDLVMELANQLFS
jgi:V/A-type H+-transporting ATPase subunit E